MKIPIVLADFVSVDDTHLLPQRKHVSHIFKSLALNRYSLLTVKNGVAMVTTN